MSINMLDLINLSVHIFATSRCNMNCAHCFLNASNFSKEHYDLPTKNIVESVNIISELLKNVDFELEGGEIMMHPQIDEILNGINKENYNKITLTTNGTSFNNLNQLMQLSAYEGLRLRVSAEGHTEEIHNILRSNSLYNVLSFVKLATKQDIYTIIRTTLHSKNISFIEDMILTFANTGVKEIQFLEFQKCGRGALPENNYLVLNDNDILNALGIIKSISMPKGLKQISLNLSAGRLANLNNKTNIMKTNDLNVNENESASLVVNWDGSISQCPWEPFSTVISHEYPVDLELFIKENIKSRMLIHECNFCSVSKVIRKNYEL